MRQIIFDTETTGLNETSSDKSEGHRIIEIGAVEVIDRKITGRHFRQLINPEMPISADSSRITGITDETVRFSPTFAQIFDEFWEFIEDADELIAHNMPFDQSFLNRELKLLGKDFRLEERFTLIDTIRIAQEKNFRPLSLDALCKRFNIDSTQRNYHGALLDSELLAQVYLKMTGGQEELNIFVVENNNEIVEFPVLNDDWASISLTAEETEAHNAYLNKLNN